MEAWRKAGQSDAADHMEKQYGVTPFNRWCYGTAGKPGVYPSGGTCESFNKKIKSHVVSKNVSVSRPKINGMN